MVWVGGGVGIATVAAVLGLVTLIGLGGLWLWRPATAPVLDRGAAAAAAQAVVASQVNKLVGCAKGVNEQVRTSGADVTVRFEVVGEKATQVVIDRSSMNIAPVEACLAREVGQMAFAGVPDVPITLPLSIRR
jgi:hypothetical protein